ncbi:hypothetical protein D9615_007764 [Tricholomella constricta]|uniref:LIM zinc-binding domain-containing protein n=1 Tax=Tricholomella constricta TaxID=117010 RepID=A0A8H5H3G2_9AGAR|nr:hypothetical protein D9615_007764 [Tricholomella constricta]
MTPSGNGTREEAVPQGAPPDLVAVSDMLNHRTSHVWLAVFVIRGWTRLLSSSTIKSPTGTHTFFPVRPALIMTSSKSCHVKNFGTRDLRQANLPHREVTPPPDSPPLRPTLLSPPPNLTPLNDPSPDPAPLLRPNRSLATSPISSSFPRVPDTDAYADEERDTLGHRPSSPAAAPTLTSIPSNTGRSGLGGLLRTVPLTPTRSAGRPRHFASNSVGGSPMQLGSGTSGSPMKPLVQTSTGTRYGAALGGTMPIQFTGAMGGSPRKWGASGATPSCPRCGKSVYFAEQVKAVGKTYHKNCLRCTECNTLLDSSRLRDHDGEPLCVRCYGKLHGPQGGGYALLGKAGG